MGFFKSLKNFFGFGEVETEKQPSEMEYTPKNEEQNEVEVKQEVVTTEVQVENITTVGDIKSKSRKNKPSEGTEGKEKPKRPRRKPKPKSE